MSGVQEVPRRWFTEKELREPREFVAEPVSLGTPGARCLCTSVSWLLHLQSGTLGLEPYLGLCPPPQYLGL